MGKVSGSVPNSCAISGYLARMARRRVACGSSLVDQEKSSVEVERAFRRVGQEVGEAKEEEKEEEGDLIEVEAVVVVEVSRAVLVGVAVVTCDDEWLLVGSVDSLDGVERVSSVAVLMLVGRLWRIVATGEMVLVRVMTVHKDCWYAQMAWWILLLLLLLVVLLEIRSLLFMRLLLMDNALYESRVNKQLHRTHTLGSARRLGVAGG